jgi:hypothetical protein
MCCKYVAGAGAPELGELNSDHVSNVDTGGSGGATASTGAARNGVTASPALPNIVAEGEKRRARR